MRSTRFSSIATTTVSGYFLVAFCVLSGCGQSTSSATSSIETLTDPQGIVSLEVPSTWREFQSEEDTLVCGPDETDLISLRCTASVFEEGRGIEFSEQELLEFSKNTAMTLAKAISDSSVRSGKTAAGAAWASVRLKDEEEKEENVFLTFWIVTQVHKGLPHVVTVSLTTVGDDQEIEEFQSARRLAESAVNSLRFL